MSNGLCTTMLAGAFEAMAASSAPAEAASQRAGGTVPGFMIGIVALGLFACVVAAVNVIVRPRSLSLADTPGRDNRLSVLHVMGILFLWILLQVTIDACAGAWLKVNLAELAKTDPADDLLLKITTVKSLIVPLGMLGMSLLIAPLAFGHGLRRGMGLRLDHWIFDSLRGVLGFFALMPVSIGLLLAMEFFLRNHPEALKEHVLLVALRDVAPAWKAWVFVSAVVLAPLAEEVFFRGIIQSYIRRLSRRPWWAIVVTSTIFTVLHAPQYSALPSLMALSIVLGFAYERSGRLITPIVIHALFNGANMISVLSG